MRPLILFMALSTLFSTANSQAQSSIEWVSAKYSGNRPFIELDSWENPTSWNLGRVPNRRSKVYISTTQYQHHQMIALPPQGKTVYQILDVAAPYHSLQEVSLLANGTHILGQQTVIGTVGNKGKVLLKLKNQATLQSSQTDSSFVLAEEGGGTMELHTGSQLQLRKMSMGQSADARAELAISDTSSFVKLKHLEMSIQGHSTLYMDRQASAEIDYIKMALEGDGSHLSKATIRLRDEGTVLRVPYQLELAQQGHANIQVSHGAHLIAQNIKDLTPKKSNARNDIEIMHDGKLTVIDSMTLGSSDHFRMHLLQDSCLNVDSLHLLAEKKTRQRNRLLISNRSAMNIQNLWTMNAKNSVLTTKITQESVVYAKKLVMGQFGKETPILNITDNSKYTGDSAIIGLNESAVMVLKNNAIMQLKNDLTIGQNDGSSGLLYIYSYAPTAEQMIYGVLVEAKKIILGPEGHAEIHVYNDENNMLPTYITGDIEGYGYLRKSGSGTLRLVGRQSWEGLFDIEEGTVDIPNGSYLSPLVDHKVDQEATLCLHQKTQNIHSLLNDGKVQFDGSLQGSILLIDDRLLGQGQFDMHANFAQLWTDQIEIVHTLSGEHALNFQIHEPNLNFGRLLVAVAHRIEPEDPLFYLSSKYTDALGVYQDVGLHRMNLELVKETDAEQVTYWFLQTRLRKPLATSDRRLQYAHLSLPAQNAIETLKTYRPKAHLVHQGVLSPLPPIAAHLEPPLSAIASPAQLTGHLSPLNRWENHQVLGLSYALQDHHARYTFETFTTKNKGSSAHRYSGEPMGTTHAARVKWQHGSGWQSYAGIEHGQYAPPASSPTWRSPLAVKTGRGFQTHLTSLGVAYFESLPSHWSVGPHVQYHRLRTDPLAFQWDHHQNATLSAQSKHSFATQFGVQIQYQDPPETLYPVSLRLETFYKKHQENMQLQTETQRVEVPYKTAGYDIYAHLEGQISQQAQWHIALENQYLAGEPRRWGILTKWSYLF